MSNESAGDGAPPALTDDEKVAPIALLAGVIESDRFPLSPRTRPA